MIIGGASQDVVRIHVNPPVIGTVLEADKIVKIDRVEVELEIRVVIIEDLKGDSRGHRGSKPEAIVFVDGVKASRVHSPAHLEEAQLLLGPAPKNRADLAIGHDDRPVIAKEEVQQSSDEISNK